MFCGIIEAMARVSRQLSILLMIASAAGLLASPVPAAAAAGVSVDFDRDIQPIFSDNCYQCHGPDEKARKAKLRLDTKEGAFRLRNAKTVIIPGKSSESEMVRRITTDDPDDHMPPPEANKKLTAKQIDLLKQWIDAGAKWGEHWAFKPITAPNVPRVSNTKWPHNEIDRFVLARVEQQKIQPSPAAGRERLLRRVTFDLTGLPPTPAELDAFLGDKSPNGFEKVVDRLLASPRYGERMAVEWLDIARYADTYGYQMDAPRPMWPYRDWVIKAFNENLSFDQFVTWQLAGDLLPKPTKEQRLATAFNRLHLQNEEGGVVDEEFRVAYVDDRVDTFGTAFLGLTVQCAHCHDHKFDPITMKDFYSLFAMFQNIDEAGQIPYTGFVQDMPAPTLLLSDEKTDEMLAKQQRHIAQKEKQAPLLKEAARDAFGEWLQHKPESPSVPGLVASFSFDELKDNKISNAVDGSKPGTAQEGPKLVAGRAGEAALLNGDNGFTFPNIGHFSRSDPFSVSIWIKTAARSPRQVIVHDTKAPADAGSRGYELLLEEGRVWVGVHHQWPGNSIAVKTAQQLPTNEWVQVGFTYDGSSHASGLRVYVNGRPVEVQVIRDNLRKDITYGNGEPDLAIGYRFRDSGFRDGMVDDFKVFNRALTPIEMTDVSGLDDLRKAWKTSPDQLTAQQRDGLLEYYAANFYPPAQQFRAELNSLRREHNHTVNAIPEIEVMEEMATPKPAYILKRGQYDARGEQVTANTPGFLPKMPATAPRNRLGLARWLLTRDNPLFARVTVNRAWQMMFGKGIVETADNFGTRGAVPTNPELLDWLANDFMNGGWNYKALLKEIAMSATYQQSSKASADLLARDPQNDLLARGPAQRLTAEMLRDQALAEGGLLLEKLGGPSVKPYQPPGLWEIGMGNPKYEQSHGEDLHRRSLYTFWKRTVPPPSMVSFDAAQRNVCLVKRQSTSTPLQALCLLNDVQFTEAARHISERMLREGGNDEAQRLTWAFRLVTSRKPTQKELTVLEQLFREQHQLFSADQQAAAKLLAVGESANSPAFPAADLAAGTALAEALLNHDEAIMKR
jgi:hypothetical protein